MFRFVSYNCLSTIFLLFLFTVGFTNGTVDKQNNFGLQAQGRPLLIRALIRAGVSVCASRRPRSRDGADVARNAGGRQKRIDAEPVVVGVDAHRRSRRDAGGRRRWRRVGRRARKLGVGETQPLPAARRQGETRFPFPSSLFRRSAGLVSGALWAAFLLAFLLRPLSSSPVPFSCRSGSHPPPCRPGVCHLPPLPSPLPHPLIPSLFPQDDEINTQCQLVEKLSGELADQESLIESSRRQLDELQSDVSRMAGESDAAKDEVKEVLQALEELAVSYDQKAEEAATRGRENDSLSDELQRKTVRGRRRGEGGEGRGGEEGLQPEGGGGGDEGPGERLAERRAAAQDGEREGERRGRGGKGREGGEGRGERGGEKKRWWEEHLVQVMICTWIFAV